MFTFFLLNLDALGKWFKVGLFFSLPFFVCRGGGGVQVGFPCECLAENPMMHKRSEHLMRCGIDCQLMMRIFLFHMLLELGGLAMILAYDLSKF